MQKKISHRAFIFTLLLLLIGVVPEAEPRARTRQPRLAYILKQGETDQDVIKSEVFQRLFQNSKKRSGQSDADYLQSLNASNSAEDQQSGYIYLSSKEASEPAQTVVLSALDERSEVYVINRGETLSEIASKRIQRRNSKDDLYNPRGRLAKLITANPQIKKPDLVYPGQWVFTRDLDLIFNSGSERPAVVDSTPAESLAVDLPAAVPTATPEPPFVCTECNLIDAQLKLSYWRLSGMDATSRSTGRVVSTLAPGIRLWGEHQLAEKLWIYLSGELSLVTFVAPTNRTLAETSKTFAEAHLGFRREFSDRFSLGISFSEITRAILVARSIQSIEVSSALAPSLGAVTHYSILKSDAYETRALGSYDYFLSGNINGNPVSASHRLGLGLEWSKKFVNFSWQVGSFYRTHSQDSLIGSNTLLELSFYSGLRWTPKSSN